MPFCQHCKVTGLLRTEVEFDDAHQTVLCRPCYLLEYPNGRSDVAIRQVTQPGFGFGLYITGEQIEIQMRYNGISGQVYVPMDELKKLFKSNG